MLKAETLPDSIEAEENLSVGEVSNEVSFDNIRDTAEEVLEASEQASRRSLDIASDDKEPQDITPLRNTARPRITLCAQLTGCMCVNGKCKLINENRMGLFVLIVLMLLLGHLLLFLFLF